MRSSWLSVTAESLRRVQSLQALHVVGRRHPVAAVRGNVVVPRRPGATPPGQQARIGVHHDAVGLVVDGPKDGTFLGAGILKHLQCLVAMGREHHLVEAGDMPTGHGDVDVVGRSPHTGHRRAGLDSIAKWPRQRLDVLARASADRETSAASP